MDFKNVIIVNDFNYIQGGASKVAIDTANYLKNENFNVFFFSAVNKKEEEIDGITYVSTNQKEALKEKNKLLGFINGIYNLKAKYMFKKLIKEMDKENTIIHIHGWTKALSSSVFDVAFKEGFKIVVTLHDYFSICPNGGFFDYKKNKICKKNPLSYECIVCNCDSRNYFFKIYRLIRHVVQNKIVKLDKKLRYAIGISNLSIEILKKRLNDSINILKIYNPIEFEKKYLVDNNNVKENKYFLYVGRINKEKGVDLFCEAISEIGKKGIVVGDGDEKIKLQEKYPNIEFVGWKNSEDVKGYMKNARALIFPSRWYETAGLTILEAQCEGIPVIVNGSCVGREFIKNKEYIFYNLEELKNIILNIDEYDFEIINFERFDKEYYINELKKFYKFILEN